MIAAQAPQVLQRTSYDVLMSDGTSHYFAIESLSRGLRLHPIFIINDWDHYGHMGGKFYQTIEALLDDACPGWSSYSPFNPPKPKSHREQTTLIKRALAEHDINAHVKHYCGALIVEIGRPVTSEDWDNIRHIVEGALGESDKFALGGLHVFEKFESKKAAGWGRGNKRIFW